MGVYYNPDNEDFKRNLRSKIYVDKSLIIQQTNQVLDTDDSFICVSRPRRFGKSMAANMLTAYYSKGCDSRALFKGLKIEYDPSFENDLNKHDVIRIDFAAVDGRTENKAEIVSAAQRYVCQELKEAFPDAIPDKENRIADMLTAIKQKYPKQKFIIIIDEYDLIFRNYKDDTKLQTQYLDFLNSLFKNGDIKANISLAYLTGILPVIREQAQSKLNEFRNISMLDPYEFAEFVGFTEGEVKALCDKYNMDFGEMKKWYNGYHFDEVKNVYNPKSVVDAITSHKFKDYWVQTSSAETLFTYIGLDYDGLKEDVECLIAGEHISVKTSRFDNTLTTIKTKDDVLTYFIHLGYLAYDSREDKCYIPNYEIQQEWIGTIGELQRYSVVVNYINNSEKLLKETWKGNEEYVAKALDEAHSKNTSILKYNDENSLHAVVAYAYIYANTYYTILREMPTGKGFADIAYIPDNKDNKDTPAMVVELKFDEAVDTAIDQIKNKNYPQALEHYKDNMLLVGITYDKETKKHVCKIERVAE